jgi:hypothetical protein
MTGSAIAPCRISGSPVGDILYKTAREDLMKTELPTIGKVSSEIFDEIILPQLGGSVRKS